MEAKDYISQAVKNEGVDVIAARAGVSRATIFRVLSGSTPKLGTLRRLLGAIGHGLVLDVVPGDHPHQQASGE